MNLKSLASISLTLALINGSPAPTHSDTKVSTATGQFQRIEQPLWSKLAVTGAGVGLVGLELWWFLPSRRKVQLR